MIRKLFLVVTAVIIAATNGRSFAAGTADAVTSRTNVVYGTADGQDLLMDVLFPPTDMSTSTPAPRAAIIFVHGGGWAGGDKKDFNRIATELVGRGFVGFNVNYRLVKPNANKWPAQIDDCQLAVRWIRAHAVQYNIDPDSLGAMGGSAGGHLVSLLGTTDTRTTESVEFPDWSSRVNCVVDLFGPSDLTEDFPTTGIIGNVQQIVENLFGKPMAEVKEIAREASPITHVANAVPFLIFQGDKDTIVLPPQSTRFHAALQKAGKDSKLVMMKDVGHNINTMKMDEFYAECVAFYRKNLKAAGGGR
ncbi:MAG: alpha/beta hydrolase [Candidatus Sumerlaeaceae bacterium]|nr:alpha/beta hydrolase [Candidatus Sumerlaeaceae bacterium]